MKVCVDYNRNKIRCVDSNKKVKKNTHMKCGSCERKRMFFFLIIYLIFNIC